MLRIIEGKREIALGNLNTFILLNDNDFDLLIKTKLNKKEILKTINEVKNKNPGEWTIYEIIGALTPYCEEIINLWDAQILYY